MGETTRAADALVAATSAGGRQRRESGLIAMQLHQGGDLGDWCGDAWDGGETTRLACRRYEWNAL